MGDDLSTSGNPDKNGRPIKFGPLHMDAISYFHSVKMSYSRFTAKFSPICLKLLTLFFSTDP